MWEGPCECNTPLTLTRNPEPLSQEDRGEKQARRKERGSFHLNVTHLQDLTLRRPFPT